MPWLAGPVLHSWEVLGAKENRQFCSVAVVYTKAQTISLATSSTDDKWEANALSSLGTKKLLQTFLAFVLSLFSSKAHNGVNLALVHRLPDNSSPGNPNTIQSP